MDHQELISKARSQFGKILPSDVPALSPDDYPIATVREAAMLHFESEDKTKDRVFMLLDLDTGDFIGGGISPRKKS